MLGDPSLKKLTEKYIAKVIRSRFFGEKYRGKGLAGQEKSNRKI